MIDRKKGVADKENRSMKSPAIEARKQRHLNSHVILTMIATAIITAEAFSLIQKNDEKTRSNIQNISIDAKALRGSIPYLTAMQQQRVLAQALANNRVVRLTARDPFHTSRIDVWTTTNGGLIGGVVEVVFDRPASLKGGWLALDYNCTEAKIPLYASYPYQALFTGVRSMLIFVDIQRNRVVGISPGPSSHTRDVAYIHRRRLRFKCS